MKSKSTTKPWKEAQPYIMDASKSFQNTYKANRAGDQQISDTLRGGIGSLAQRAFGTNEGVEAAQAYNNRVLGGEFMSGNPQLEAMIAKTRGNVMDGVNTVFSRSGMSGSTGHGEDLGRGLGEAELGLRYGDYDKERARVAQAAAMAPELFAGEFAGIPALLGASETALNAPYAGARNYASGIGGLLGNYTTTTQSGGIGQMLAGLAGSGLSAWAGGGFKGI